ncbi:hypothetical protein [Leptolyngbya sp. PCC 6406]|uniref:hypothetical protein n=1 Tax=Leptolyngbya sp. PCC 6406 TaxID=1173264 RepID=UPI0002AC1940|nr:hypothetical protein [Leptolyngbya sp. PCC 6406]
MRSQAYWPSNHLTADLPSGLAHLGQTWKATMAELVHRAIAYLDVSHQPHVWKSLDPQGWTLWNAYDPQSGQWISKLSDTEMRIWLEQRHYQG